MARITKNAGTVWAAALLMAAPVFAFEGGMGTARSIAEQVGQQLMSLAYYTVFDEMSFRVDAGKVTLSGQVTQPVLKEDAERAVRRIPGVVAVVDQIEILPLSRVDDQIRRGIYYAVYGYAPLERYGLGSQPAIRIIVKNGRVTLTGAVASQMDRMLVYERAISVPGVSSISNQLMVEA